MFLTNLTRAAAAPPKARASTAPPSPGSGPADVLMAAAIHVSRDSAGAKSLRRRLTRFAVSCIKGYRLSVDNSCIPKAVTRR